MSPPLREKTLAAIYNIHRQKRSGKKICRRQLNDSAMAGSAMVTKCEPGETQVKKEKVEEEEEGTASENNALTLVEVKLEKEEEAGHLVTCGILKRKRLSRSGRSTRYSESFEEDNKQLIIPPRRKQLTTRWNSDRIKFAEQTLADVLKENGATFETPVSRNFLRVTARSNIGDTGLLDHCLKHMDGKVTPGGADRFRRCYNTDGTMQYWLESADLIKIKLESGIPDPTWVPPSWWKAQTVSHDASAVSSKLLMGEIEQMKSEIKELAAKQKLPDHAEATEKLCKDLMSWREKADKQMLEISNSLTSTQGMFKELISWKDKVEQKLVGISNTLSNLQPNGSTSFSPGPENWEHILKNANLEDFTGNDFEPWDDLIDGLPEAVRPDTYALLPNPCKSSLQDHTLFEEQSLVNIDMQRTESCMTRGESRSSSQDKAELTPGSSITAGPKSDIDDPAIHNQEILKELVTWKAKAEQQLTDLSNAVLALKGQNQPNWRYP
ncbi:PREDICTED: protein DYAD-like isoform X1 [Camelina sativa]|uniref:Protein DYAD-like isoform X1 n=1 Tax=Camelina sativa TaxID=90675 RepID=A0ABM1QAX2_CAMSA|nr:PREDICTED: protein DYAD-like isoform X1 [Camelina sativa]